MTLFRALLAAVGAVLLLAGCGGGSGSAGGSTNTGASSTGTSASSGGQSGAYQGGFEICSTGTVAEVASIYGASEPTAEAVATTVAEAVSGGTPGDAEEAKQGCLDAFEKSK